jgi:undecaprenyl diphosphate synthase
VHRDLSIPQHVAIVMDGNGRWAKKRFLPRFFGHKAGVDTLIRTIDACADRGIRYLTVFAFSSENWNRPADEVSGLMGLVLVAQAKYMARMVGKGVRVVTPVTVRRCPTGCARLGTRSSRPLATTHA